MVELRLASPNLCSVLPSLDASCESLIRVRSNSMIYEMSAL
jgi:hypothetical protein